MEKERKKLQQGWGGKMKPSPDERANPKSNQWLGFHFGTGS